MHDLRHDPEGDVIPRGALIVRDGTICVFNPGDGVTAWCNVTIAPPPDAPAPDLRTADQRHADELAELTGRIEAIEAALHTQANMLQVLWLEREARG